MHTEINLLASNCLLKSQFVIQKASTVTDLHCATQHLQQQFHLFVNSFIWTLAVMLHSVNDNVNNNKAHFILVHGQINALEHII